MFIRLAASCQLQKTLRKLTNPSGSELRVLSLTNKIYLETALPGLLIIEPEAAKRDWHCSHWRERAHDIIRQLAAAL